MGAGGHYPCVFFALARERGPFLKSRSPTQQVSDSPFPAWLSGDGGSRVLVAEIGVGMNAAATAAQWALSRPHFLGEVFEPAAIIFAGFAGSLSPSLKIGDLVLADAVVNESGRSLRTQWPETSPPDSTVTMQRGRILTVSRLIGDPAEKQLLGEKHQAVAVDMESSAIAEICHARGVPFGCLRAISDDVQTALSPALLRVLAGGKVSASRLLWALARRPWLLKQLLILGSTTRHAAQQLANGLSALL